MVTCPKKFSAWINSDNIEFIKCKKNIKLILKNVKGFTLYEIYNKCNKCDNREVINNNDYQLIKYFKYRTGFLEFLTCKNKNIKFSFVFLNAEYKNNCWIWNVKPNALFLNNEFISNYNNFSGKNLTCSLDSINEIKPTYYCVINDNSPECSKQPKCPYQLCTSRKIIRDTNTLIAWYKYPNGTIEKVFIGLETANSIFDINNINNNKKVTKYYSPPPSFD